MMIAERSRSSIRAPQWMRQTMLLFLFTLSTLFGVDRALACQAQVLMLGTPNLTVDQGQNATLAMRWIGEPQPENYQVFVHFVSSNGTQYPGGDHAPAVSTSTWNGPVNYNHVRAIPTSMPAGTYSIRVGLYQGAPPYNRVALTPGAGVTADTENRYTVGTLIVRAPNSPTPAPAPTPVPAPTPTPTPVPAPVPSYSLAITAPAAGATVSGTIQVKGTGPGFLNVEVLNASGALLGRATPDSSGNFTANVDTTKLGNGSQTLTVDAWDSPAGQPFTHTAEKKISVNVQNSGGAYPPPAGNDTPVGGPGGYTKIVMNDSFGSSKAGANFTSLSQFNKGVYGRTGTGWDDYMCSWDCGKANLAMASDHLEIRPTSGKSGFISSHFEYLPTGSEHVYYEIRAATGRGATSPQTWPAFWLFAGNEPGSNNAQSEFDIMETYMNQWDSSGNSSSGYPYHFAAVIHDNANASSEFKIIETPGIDVTTTYNVYGTEMYRGSNGNLQFNIYFNGKLVYSSSSGLNWRSTPPSMFIGWNPGSTSWSPSVMKLDYVKAWVK